MVVASGKKRTLRVMNVDKKDEGKYTCKVQGKSTTAKLYAAREYNPPSHRSLVLLYFIGLTMSTIDIIVITDVKVRLWVLMRDQSLTHLCIDISLIPQHILDHDISLKS